MTMITNRSEPDPHLFAPLLDNPPLILPILTTKTSLDMSPICSSNLSSSTVSEFQRAPVDHDERRLSDRSPENDVLKLIRIPSYASRSSGWFVRFAPRILRAHSRSLSRRIVGVQLGASLRHVEGPVKGDRKSVV